MKKILLTQLFVLLAISSFAQPIYSSSGGIETPYKEKYKFTAKLDEKTNTLSFETDAPVTIAVLSTYNSEELAVRKGKENTNTYTKNGQQYSYDLKSQLLKDKYAYWLKVSTGDNGAPLAEYFFRKKIREEAGINAADAEEENVQVIDNKNQLTNEWRLTKKVSSDETMSKRRWEYVYEKDGRIQTVKFFYEEVLSSTESKFKFDNNGKVISYNTAGAEIQPFTTNIQYDDKGRITKTNDVNGSNKQIGTTNTFTYSGNKITVLKMPKILGTNADITVPYFEHSEFYTEKGDYIEMREEQPSEIQKWIISLRKNAGALLDPDPDLFTGGYGPLPLFYLVSTPTPLKNKITRDKNGLIISFLKTEQIDGKTYNFKIDYTYTKIAAGPGKKEITTTAAPDNKIETDDNFSGGNKALADPSRPVIETSIKCEAGKTKIINTLKGLDGVFAVKIDIKTGILKLNYSSDGTPFDNIIKTILDNGFDVLDDGEHTGIKKSTKPSANPCKTKTAK